MSNVFFISDLHFGHQRILEFSPMRMGECPSSHDQAIITNWNKVVTKRDKVFVLGDVCFDIRLVDQLSELNGTKSLIIGNHDKFDYGVYLKHFKEIHGFRTHKGYWLSHCPIHPDELRGRKNIHGHVHQNIICDVYGVPDERYIPVCVENTGGSPVPFDMIKSGEYKPRRC